MAAITDVPQATWGEDELAQLKGDYAELRGTLTEAVTKFNPTPGEGCRYSALEVAVRCATN